MDLELMSELTAQAVANATMLPKPAYTSPEWFEAERRPVHDRAWTYVCHTSELEAGSFRRVRVGAEDMVFTRDRDGVLHALHNVCRHRGAEVVTTDCGTARSLVCPYHLWSYDLSGELKVAHGMPDAMSTSDFPLESTVVREWHGMVFVVPDDNALDNSGFEPVAKDPDEFARLRLEEAKVVHTEVYEIAANWKAVRENFLECYHCSSNHPQLLAAYDLGASYDGAGREIDAFPMKDGACSLSLDGQPVCKRSFGDFENVPTSEWTYMFAHGSPAFIVVANPDHAVVFGFTPMSVDRTVLKCDWLVHHDAVEGVDYEVKNVIVVWHETNLQDIALCESAQRGMASSAFEPGPLSPDREPGIFDFHQKYVGWLRDGLPEAAQLG
jgi:Rieske 2Fe-2S family protein